MDRIHPVLALSASCLVFCGAAPAQALVQQDASGWTISARSASRLEVVRELAGRSATVLLGEEAALADSRKLTLQWHGRSLQAAWLAVLDGGPNHAVQCTRERCRVWTLGGSPAAPARHDAPSAAPSHAPDPAGLFPAQ